MRAIQTPIPTPAARRIALAVGVLACLALGACASKPEPVAVRPTLRRVDALPGHVLVVPVTPEGEPETSPLDVKLSDGRELEAGLYWIGVEIDPASAGAWLPDPGRWTATPAGSPRPRGAIGSWHAVITVPHDAIGQTIWIGRTRIEPNWLPDPALALREILSRTKTAERPWELPVDPALLEEPTLRALAEPETHSPVRRWRWLLMTDGLEPAPEPVLPGLAGLRALPAGFGDPVLEALARYTESRWRSALALLWSEDPALAERLKQRLALVVRSGDASFPAWTTDQGELGALLNELTDLDDSPRRRALRAERFLNDAPRMTARLVDPAAATVAGEPRAAVEIANLDELPNLFWVRGDPGESTPVPVEIGPRVAVEALAPRPVPVQIAEAGADNLRVHLGTDMRGLNTAPEAIGVGPPGLQLFLFKRDLTLDRWIGFGVGPEGDPSTAGLLYRDERGWVLMLECQRPIAPAGARPPESVEVWCGARGLSSHPVRVGETEALDRGDRWVAYVRLPEGAVGADGLLRLGVVRHDALGRRSAWPVAMTPWQAEPGRALIDTNAWPAAIPPTSFPN